MNFLKIDTPSVKDAVKKISKYATDSQFHPIIVDTAGRLHIDDELMKELKDVKDELSPF